MAEVEGEVNLGSKEIGLSTGYDFGAGLARRCHFRR